MNMGKRGLSPIIATMLLILIAVILAAIIFWWVRQFVKESVTKDLGGGEQPIDSFCSEVNFNADIESGELTVQNNGQVPIYGIEIKKKGFASVSSLGEAVSRYLGVKSGETYTFGQSEYMGTPPSSGDSVLLVPVLLGQGRDAEKAYPCDDKYGVEAQVA